MLKDKKAVIFDLDGTVVDSMWMWEAIDIEYLGRFGIALPPDLQKKISGMSFSETAVYFKREFSIPDSLEKIKADWNRMAMDKYRDEVTLKPGVFDFLIKLKERGIKTGIATSNSRELAMAVLESRGLLPYFDEIHMSCEVEHGKPAPDIYLFVAECLKTAPEDCLVFEDITEGILAAKAAGMAVCGVEDTFSENYREEKKELADYYIESYDEIVWQKEK
ncbi:MAG: HAD family phosphatase [Lachnospiraceae bacterium]|nr:HAD family phosphatase [Lachnospiraceae bacterium]